MPDLTAIIRAGEVELASPRHGPPPIRGLARAFNTMTERLGKHEQQRRNLMADVAHELRTPLTIIQGKLEGLLDGVYAREDAQLSEILGETSLLSRLIEDLRTLALSEAGVLRLEKEPTDAGELVRDVMRVFATEAFAQQVTLKTEAPTELPLVMIDAVRIRQVLNNILSNALRHTPSGGLIETIVGARDDAEVWVQVRDTGGEMSQATCIRALRKGTRIEGIRTRSNYRSQPCSSARWRNSGGQPARLGDHDQVHPSIRCATLIRALSPSRALAVPGWPVSVQKRRPRNPPIP
jgi:signal transduction histidine kinase